MNKVLFTRKAIDTDELKRRTGKERDKSHFVVEKVIELTKEKYNTFSNDLFSDYDFISENIEKMYVDNNQIWHCILVKTFGEREGILVESEGYDYARYSAYYPENEDTS